MKKLLVILGPTGVGKSHLALRLAKQFKGEVVSADSRQVYQEMDIATGKEVDLLRNGQARKGNGFWEIQGVKVHLYDVLAPVETFSVATYQQKALPLIKKLQSENRLPILTGGTGLYVTSVTDGLKIPKAKPDQKLRDKLASTDASVLYQKLQEVDPITAARIDENNPRRLTRALEVYYLTGEPFSSLQSRFKVDFDLLFIGLTTRREELYHRADQLVEKWMELGLKEETEVLLAKYDRNLPAMSAIGYRQIGMYLEGKLTLEEAKQRIKYDLHSYIRRQLTWFKRDSRIHWFDIAEPGWEEKVGALVSGWYQSQTN